MVIKEEKREVATSVNIALHDLQHDLGAFQRWGLSVLSQARIFSAKSASVDVSCLCYLQAGRRLKHTKASSFRLGRAVARNGVR